MLPLRRNVLIFHSGALGDFVMTWPLAMASARLFAQSRVIFVTASQKGALAEKLLRVDSTDAEGGWHALFSDSSNMPEKPAKLLEGAHAIISFVSTADDQWSHNVQQIVPDAQIVHISTKMPDLTTAHVTEHIVQQLRPIPALQSAATQMLKWMSDHGVGSRVPKKDAPIVIHPGSGAARKCWPADRFIELAERVSATKQKVRFVLGEVEREQWPAEQIQRLSRAAEVVQPKTYVELFDVIYAGRVFVGNDTGPTHLAGITGVPTIALFGGNPTRWRPIGPRVEIIAKESIDTISVNEVLASVSL